MAAFRALAFLLLSCHAAASDADGTSAAQPAANPIRSAKKDTEKGLEGERVAYNEMEFAEMAEAAELAHTPVKKQLLLEQQEFLRELISNLISNAADALDKARPRSVPDESPPGDTKDLEVKIEHDAKNKAISIIDTGVGMTRANLIGQFGVGFYSAFLVADKVTVTSKCNEELMQHMCVLSSPDASFTVVVDRSGNKLGRGSRVTLHLKEDAHDYLSKEDARELKKLARKYSQFIPYPVYVKVKNAWEQVNIGEPIWLRAKEYIKQEEYNAFYKSISNDCLDPLAYRRFKSEGQIVFNSILFLPKKAPFDMMDWTKQSGVRPFVRGVFVGQKIVEQLLPRYLNFVRGVVDFDNMNNMKVISKELVHKVLTWINGEKQKKEKEESKDKKDEESTWAKFYKNVNKNLKMGCYEDDSNRHQISKLLRFTTTKSGDKDISLDKYLDGMSPGQVNIYYTSGEISEFQEEALMLSDPFDQPCIQKLVDYEGKKFVRLDWLSVRYPNDSIQWMRIMFKFLTDWWKKKLTENPAISAAGIKINKVELTNRLTDRPVGVDHLFAECLAQDQRPVTLEVNANHPLVRDLLPKVKANEEDAVALGRAQGFFLIALIESGYEIAHHPQRHYQTTCLHDRLDAPSKEVAKEVEEVEAAEEPKDDKKKKKGEAAKELTMPTDEHDRRLTSSDMFV